MSTTDAAAQVHADGKVLLAVAEGDPGHQPDETVLSHIFSCEACSSTLKEMRASLSILKTGAKPAPAKSVDDLLAAEGIDLAQSDSDSYAAERRAKSLIWKLAIIGGLLTAGLLWLQSSTASHV
jgi:hypothetical protein